MSNTFEGFKPYKRRCTKITPAMRDRIIELGLQGIPQTEIAKEVGVSRAAVCTNLRKSGVAYYEKIDYLQLLREKDERIAELEGKLSALAQIFNS